MHWLVLKRQRKEDRSNVFEEMVAGDFPKVTERHQTPGSRRLQTLSNTDTKKITARHEARHKVRPLNIQDREETTHGLRRHCNKTDDGFSTEIMKGDGII